MHEHNHHHEDCKQSVAMELCRKSGENPSKLGIVLAGFGATSEKARQGLAGILRAASREYPEAQVCLAFTSLKVRRKLRSQGLDPRCPVCVLSEMRDLGVGRVVVQSLHSVPGIEFEFLRAQALSFKHPRKGFLDMEIGEPLLASDLDIETAVKALPSYLPEDILPEESVLLVGHGTPHKAQEQYLKFESRVRESQPKLRLALLTGEPGFSHALAKLRDDKAKSVRIVPFMSVAGHHVTKDLGGSSPDSWINMFKKAGMQAVLAPRATACHPGFAGIWLNHLRAALNRLSLT